MTSRKPRDNTKNNATPQKSVKGGVAAKDTTASGGKAVITSGDKNTQVLAATVGGAVIGNLIVPGIGGAIFGGVIGALLGNGSRGKGGK